MLFTMDVGVSKVLYGQVKSLVIKVIMYRMISNMSDVTLKWEIKGHLADVIFCGTFGQL